MATGPAVTERAVSGWPGMGTPAFPDIRGAAGRLGQGPPTEKAPGTISGGSAASGNSGGLRFAGNSTVVSAPRSKPVEKVTRRLNASQSDPRVGKRACGVHQCPIAVWKGARERALSRRVGTTVRSGIHLIEVFPAEVGKAEAPEAKNIELTRAHSIPAGRAAGHSEAAIVRPAVAISARSHF